MHALTLRIWLVSVCVCVHVTHINAACAWARAHLQRGGIGLIQQNLQQRLPPHPRARCQKNYNNQELI